MLYVLRSNVQTYWWLVRITYLGWSLRRTLAAQTRADLRWHREKANA